MAIPVSNMFDGLEVEDDGVESEVCKITFESGSKP